MDTSEDVKVTCNGNNTFGRFLSLRRLGGFRQDALAACEIEVNVFAWGESSFHFYIHLHLCELCRDINKLLYNYYCGIAQYLLLNLNEV